MHILLIPINFPNTYNQQSHIFFEDQARTLASKGLKVGVLAITPISVKTIWQNKKLDFGFQKIHENGVTVFRYQFPALPKMQRLNYQMRKWIGKRLFEKYRKTYGNPDLLHIHVSLAGEIALWIKKTFMIPYIVTEHYSSFIKNQIPNWQKKIAKKVFQNSQKNIAVSKMFATALQNNYQENFEYLPNSVDTKHFIPKTQINSSQSIKHFLSIGNLKPEKNQEMLIQAFTKAFKNRKQFRLTIAGDGPEYSRLLKSIKKLDMQNQITLYGRARRKDVVQLLHDANYFVLPSKYETFGVVLIEAMSCGLPVIATKSAGPESIITDNKLGILCDAEEKQLAHTMIKASGYRFDRNFIRKYAEDHFSANAIADKLKSIYIEAINAN